MKWAYMSQKVFFLDDLSMTMWGRGGWELVGFTQNQDNLKYTLVFKKQIV